MTKPTTKSQKLVLICFAIGVVVFGAGRIFLPGIAWWIEAIVALLVFSGLYQGMLKQMAAETIVDNKRD